MSFVVDSFYLLNQFEEKAESKLKFSDTVLALARCRGWHLWCRLMQSIWHVSENVRC